MTRRFIGVLLLTLAGCASTTPQQATMATSPAAPPPAAPAPAPGPAAAASAPASAAEPPGAKPPECIVMHATTEPAGLKEEGRWLHDHYPGWKKVSQALVTGEGDKRFDRVDIVVPSGEKHSVCFDITGFFGKF